MGKEPPRSTTRRRLNPKFPRRRTPTLLGRRARFLGPVTSPASAGFVSLGRSPTKVADSPCDLSTKVVHLELGRLWVFVLGVPTFFDRTGPRRCSAISVGGRSSWPTTGD